MTVRRQRSEASPPTGKHAPASVHGLRSGRTAALLVLLAAAGFLTYSNALQSPPVLDDRITLYENPQLRELWRPDVLFPERELPVAGRPLVNVSFAVNYAIGGFDPVGYRLVNIGIHVLCSLLLFGVVRRALVRTNDDQQRHATLLAWAAALLWLVHPLNSEVVNYITQRTESMMAVFYLLTMYASVRSAAVPIAATASTARSAARTRQGTPRNVQASSRWWYPCAVAACAFGMLCKETMVTAPVMVMLFDRALVFPSWRAAFRARWPFYLALMATWIVLIAVLSSGPRMRSAGFNSGVPVWTYLLNQTVMIVQYLKLTFWPVHLVAHYGFPQPLTIGTIWPYGIVVVGILAATVVAFIARPRVGLAGAWFFLTLAPTSSIVPIATEVGAERRMYLPLMAVVVLLVVGSVRLATYLPGRARTSPIRLGAIGYTTLVALGLALTIATVQRNSEYRSALTLAGTVLERWPTALAHQYVGEELLGAGRREEGVAQLRLAVSGAPRAYYTLGMEMYREGRYSDAIADLRQFVEREPLLIEVPTAHVYIGLAHGQLREWDKAAEEARVALGMMPRHSQARGLLADALFNQEMVAEAIRAYRDYLQLKPDDTNALANLGIALVSSGDTNGAVDTFRRAVEVDPANSDARRNLATVLLDANRVDEAIAAARSALTMRPSDAFLYDLLGQALARQGRFAEAQQALERGLGLEPNNAELRAHRDQLMAIQARRVGR